MNLTIQPADLSFLESAPEAVRSEARTLHAEFLNATRPLGRSLREVAGRVGKSFDRVWALYFEWKRNGCSIRVLVNRAKAPALAARVENSFVNKQDFTQWMKALAERNQRKTRPAWREFTRLWRMGQTIPGLDNALPRHCLPPGTSYANVARLVRDAFALAAMRRGLSFAVGQCGPQVFSTRVGLWYGSHYMIDDLWHDNFVVFGRQIVRVLELDVMDSFSGCLVGFGCKPRTQREDGTFENLREKFARLMVARTLWCEGYSPRGTVWIAEHGTAAISEHCRRIFRDLLPKVSVRESGITGEEQAIIGWRGEGKGNPRAKAALEAMRNLKHNELGALPAQTGLDREHRPEFTHGQLQDCAEMIKAIAALAERKPDRARQMRLNLLDYHGDFLPLLLDIYDSINRRDWHTLEGWHGCGHVVTEYRLAPTASQWLTDGEVSALPETARQLLLAAAAADPSYLQTRKLSPAEVRARHLGELTPCPAWIIGDLLGPDFAREMAAEGAYFNRIQEAELSPEALRYESVIVDTEGRRLQLADGKYLGMVNPFDLETLFVFEGGRESKLGRCLGTAARVRRVVPGDVEGLHRAFGNRSRRMKELLDPIRARHVPAVREAAAALEANADLLAGETSAEKITRESGVRRVDLVKEQLERSRERLAEEKLS